MSSDDPTTNLPSTLILNLKPCGQDFLKWLMVHGPHIKLALHNDDLPFFVVDDDSIELLIVRTVRDVVSGLDRRAEIAIPQIPSEELLTFVRKILMIIRVDFEVCPYSLNKC